MALLLLLSEESVKEHWQLRQLLCYFVCCSALLRVGMGKLEGRMVRKESCVEKNLQHKVFNLSSIPCQSHRMNHLLHSSPKFVGRF